MVLLNVIFVDDTSKDADTLIREYYATMPARSKVILYVRNSGTNCFAIVFKGSDSYGCYLVLTPNVNIVFNSNINGTWYTKTVSLT